MIGYTVHLEFHNYGRFEVTEIELPRNTFLREIGRIKFEPIRLERNARFRLELGDDIADDFADFLEGNAPINAELHYSENGENEVSKWLNTSSDDSEIEWMLVHGSTIEVLKNVRQILTTPILPIRKLARNDSGIDDAFRDAVVEVKSALERLRNFQRYNNTPLLLARRLAEGPESDIRVLLDSWLHFGAAFPDPEGRRGNVFREQVERIIEELDSIDGFDEAHPIEDINMVFRRIVGLNHYIYSEIIKHLVESMPQIPPIPPDGIISGVRQEMTGIYEAIHQQTTNTDVLGALLEEKVRGIVSNWINPLRIQSGSVLSSHEDRQLDGIIWDPSKAPPCISIHSAAIIHPWAVRGILEVKSNEDVTVFANRMWEIQLEMRQRAEHGEPNAAPDVLGLLIWSDDSYADVRNKSVGLVTCLFKRTVTGFVANDSAFLDLIKFVYEGILQNDSWRDIRFN